MTDVLRGVHTSTRIGQATVLFAVDACAWTIGLCAASVTLARVIGEGVRVHDTWLFVLLALAVQGTLGCEWHLYRARHLLCSFDEVKAITATVVACSAVLTAVAFAAQPSLSPAVALGGGFVALLGMCGSRGVVRVHRERRGRPHRDRAEPILVFGAGEAGASVVASMLRHPDSPYFPVALLDDDRHKHHTLVHGVPVIGGRQLLKEEAARSLARTLLVAVPSRSRELMRELRAAADEAGLAVKVLPTVSELVDGRVGVGDVRDLTLTDLLGRPPVVTDLNEMAAYITGKRVLITGAGGSIGSELCRQTHQLAPAELIMLDRDESALHATQLSLHGRALLDNSETVLADIRDMQHLTQIFQQRRPHVVFHAAALKHLPLLEQFPGESVKTNVWGTLATLTAALAVDVDHFVNISTDKAADAVSVLGFSKRIAERLTAHAAEQTRGCFVSVRFGNVLGSRGSVLDAFTAQIAAGGPVTVTHPDVTRFFMTIPEAVQLVVQAGALGSPTGEVLVLDMGEPVRILDVAERLIEQAGKPINIAFTGMRRGEKMHEVLFGVGETPGATGHPSISRVAVPALDPVEVLDIDSWSSPADVYARLRHFGRDEDLAPRRPDISSLLIARTAQSLSLLRPAAESGVVAR